MEKYKYVHIFNFPDSEFNNVVAHIIADNNILHPADTLFVTRSQNEYDKMSAFVNCELNTSNSILENIYGNISELIIVHGMRSMSEILKIKPKFLPKIIWRTWGSDAGLDINSGSIIKRFVKRIIHKKRKSRIKKLRAVGICNDVDRIDLSYRYGKLNFIEVPYFLNEYQVIHQISCTNECKRSELNVLVGHSGFQNDNHIAIIERLCKMVGPNIHIFCPISYGDEAYVKRLKEYVNDRKLNNVVFVDERKKYKEYIEFLNEMDLAVFDGLGSYALGTVSALLALGVPLSLNKNGILAKAFVENEILFLESDKLEYLKITDLLNIKQHKIKENNSLLIHPYIENVKQWEKILCLE